MKLVLFHINNIKLRWSGTLYFSFLIMITYQSIENRTLGYVGRHGYLAHFHIKHQYYGCSWRQSCTKQNVYGICPQQQISKRCLPRFNTLKLRQNACHFPDDIFKCIFLNENLWISIKFSLTFVPKGPINNTPALVQIMAWRQAGNKPLPEEKMALGTDAYMRHSASMS